MRELEFEMSSVVVVAPPDAGVGVWDVGFFWFYFQDFWS
jgi:hypothetical protein